MNAHRDVTTAAPAPTEPVAAIAAGLAETTVSPPAGLLTAERSPARPPSARPASAIAPSAVVAAVVAAGALAAVLRLWNLGALGFNSDEAVYSGQAAAIAGDPALRGLFPVFRAHPLLFQMAVSLIYQIHVSDLAPRLLAVAFGLGTVAAGYAAATRIYGRRAGLVAALLLAAMPYLVVVNRQALLDGPMTFFSVLALALLARFAAEGRRRVLYAAGAALGLAFISKETSVVLIPAAYAFLAMTPSVHIRLKDVAAFFGCFAAVALPYPVSLAVAGGSASGRHFLTWQLFRPPNHVWAFYLTVVPPAIGLPVLACAAGTLVLAVSGRRWSWRESLLVCWTTVPFFFFQLWPVKGFQYLLPVAAPVATLAAGLLADTGLARGLLRGSARAASALQVTAITVVAGWLTVACWASIGAASSTSFLAGTGGLPGGRQAGQWIGAHTPAGAEMLSIGPSMANILEFYGHRRILGLSVSPNPLHRNPAYIPVTNPDLLLRSGEVQYLVWDAYSAARTHSFAARLMAYARRYQGTVVHTQTVTVSTPAGPVQRPVVIIYEVRP